MCFKLVYSSAMDISSNFAGVLLLNQPQNSAFFVATDCTTFKQYDGQRFDLFLFCQSSLRKCYTTFQFATISVSGFP